MYKGTEAHMIPRREGGTTPVSRAGSDQTDPTMEAGLPPDWAGESVEG